MSGRNWDKELAKIDKHLSSISDDELAARATATPQPAGRAAPAPVAGDASVPSPLGVVLRVGLAAALAVGLHFWPYADRCGLGLAGYLASVAVVVAAGAWAAVATWRARVAKAHIVALVVVAWGISLAAVEVLPRVGYAKDPARVSWVCH